VSCLFEETTCDEVKVTPSVHDLDDGRVCSFDLVLSKEGGVELTSGSGLLVFCFAGQVATLFAGEGGGCHLQSM
jgi:hypothetical protein